MTEQLRDGADRVADPRWHRRRPGHRAVRRRSRDGRQGARGPGLVRRGQPAARADRPDGRAGAGGGSRITQLAVVMDVRSPRLHRRSGVGAQRPGHPADHAAGAVPGGLRRHPGAPLRAEPAQPSVAGQSDLAEGITAERAMLARCPPRRPGDRHVGCRCPSCGRASSGLRRRDRRAHQRHRRVVRLQVRAADGRRHRDGRPVPAQPALGRRAAAAHRSASRRCATTYWANRERRSSSTPTIGCWTSSSTATAGRESVT